MSKSRERVFDLLFTDLGAAATTKDMQLFGLADGEIIHKVRIKHSQSFAGGAITAYTVSVGVPGDLTRYASAFDVFQAVLPRNQQMTSVLGGIEDNPTASIRVAATSTGANLNAATQGVVRIEVHTSRA